MVYSIVEQTGFVVEDQFDASQSMFESESAHLILGFDTFCEKRSKVNTKEILTESVKESKNE